MKAHCKSCGEPIVWIRMATGGRMPCNPPEKRVAVFMGADGVEAGRIVDTYTSHFATCPEADKHRRKR